MINPNITLHYSSKGRHSNRYLNQPALELSDRNEQLMEQLLFSFRPA